MARDAGRHQVARVDDVAGDAERPESPLQTVRQQHVAQLRAVVGEHGAVVVGRRGQLGGQRRVRAEECEPECRATADCVLGSVDGCVGSIKQRGQKQA